jgi:hypothetical protein
MKLPIFDGLLTSHKRTISSCVFKPQLFYFTAILGFIKILKLVPTQ